MVKDFPFGQGITELVRNALFYKGGPLRMVLKLPLSAEMKGKKISFKQLYLGN